MTFTKLVSAGNDFILIDNRLNKVKGHSSKARLVLCLADRHRGIGADGVLFLEKPRLETKANLRMQIFNPDGSQAAMCGNGIRCLAYYAYKNQITTRHMKIETLAGVLEATVKGKNRVCVELPLPREWKRKVSFKRDGILLEGSFVNTGVPHTVFPVEDLTAIDVTKLGAFIRQHAAFAPQGTNVNFIHCTTGSHQIEVRTYERGVEAETLACGTGATAAALVAVREKKVIAPVHVLTRSGETLTVDFQQEGNIFKKVWLEGTVHVVFKGEIENV